MFNREGYRRLKIDFKGISTCRNTDWKNNICPSCRAKETAIYAFGKVDQYDTSILHATAFDPDEWDLMAERYKNLLLDNTSKNYNLIISGHGNTIDKYYTKIFEKKDLPPSRKIANILGVGFYVLKVEDGKV